MPSWILLVVVQETGRDGGDVQVRLVSGIDR
jgi:hypothetical protein